MNFKIKCKTSGFRTENVEIKTNRGMVSGSLCVMGAWEGSVHRRERTETGLRAKPLCRPLRDSIEMLNAGRLCPLSTSQDG